MVKTIELYYKEVNGNDQKDFNFMSCCSYVSRIRRVL